MFWTVLLTTRAGPVHNWVSADNAILLLTLTLVKPKLIVLFPLSAIQCSLPWTMESKQSETAGHTTTLHLLLRCRTLWVIKLTGDAASMESLTF